MNAFFRTVRRLIIRWQLRSLERQARYIVEARSCALARLFEIRREKDIKETELFHFAKGQ
ncbi:hypothetical protein EGT07_13270 [Herbaspirillum sp. HC18]|nr:hypothetical protein EGT07_13270 [Herbaspirillum sp. HC18]